MSSHGAPAPRFHPATLWQAVIDARAALADQRDSHERYRGVAARAHLLAALEAYEECLITRGHPTPPPLRDELRLLRKGSATQTWNRTRRDP